MESTKNFVLNSLAFADTDLLLRWGIPAAICLIFLLGHIVEFYRHNREYKAYMARHGDRSAYIESLLHSARGKSLLLVVLGLALTGGVIQYDYTKERAELREYKLQSQISALSNQIAELNARIAQQKKAEVYADSANEQKQEELDALKQKYEQTFVNYYYLKDCGQATIYDALILRAALSEELAAIEEAPSTLLHSIQDTALSTYHSLYMDNQCEEEAVKDLAGKHRDYLKALLTQLSNTLP